MLPHHWEIVKSLPSWRQKISHVYFCMGGIAIGAKDGKCRHGKPLTSWQMEMSASLAKQVLLTFVILGILMAGIVIATLVYNKPVVSQSEEPVTQTIPNNTAQAFVVSDVVYASASDQTEDRCSYTIRLPVVTSASLDSGADAASEINRQIFKTAAYLLGWKQDADGGFHSAEKTYVQDCEEDLANYDFPFSWYTEIDYQLTQNQDGIFSVVLYWNGFFAGPHPNSSNRGLVFDVKTGKALTTKELIAADRLDEFNELVLQRLRDTGMNPGFLETISTPTFATDYGSPSLSPEEFVLLYSSLDGMGGYANVIEDLTFTREELNGMLVLP